MVQQSHSNSTVILLKKCTRNTGLSVLFRIQKQFAPFVSCSAYDPILFPAQDPDPVF